MANTWISKTNQTWKLLVFIFLMLIALVMLVVFIAEYNDRLLFLEQYLDKVSLALLSTGIGMVALLWVAFVFKCPSCKANVGKFVITKTEAATWFTTLLMLSSCPKCGKSC